MNVSEYRIITELPAPNKFLAKVSKKTGVAGDMRDSWDTWETIGVALDNNEEDAIYNAIQDAFFS